MDLHDPRWQDVLEEAPDELQHVQRQGAQLLASGLAIAEPDGAVRDLDDAAVRNGHAEDVGRKVREGRFAFPDGLTVDVPVDGPYGFGDGPEEPEVVHRIPELRPVDLTERLARQIEVNAGGMPGAIRAGEGAARHHVVDVRGARELPPPGVQDAEEAGQVPAQWRLVPGEGLDGVRGGREEGAIAARWWRGGRGVAFQAP